MSTSSESDRDDVPAPDDAPGPADDILGETHCGRLVIYCGGDAGWETCIMVDLDSSLAILNVQDHR